MLFSKMSNLSNSTIPENKGQETGYLLLFVYMTLLSVVIFSGNMLTIWVVYKTRILQRDTNAFIVSLACADLLAGCRVLYESFWYISYIGERLSTCKYCCLLLYVMFNISVAASVSNVVLISMDRFIFIVHPFRYHEKIEMRRRYLLAASWIFATVFGSVPVYYNNFVTVGFCEFVKVVPSNYQIYGQCFLFFASFVAVAMLYWRILAAARSQIRAINSAPAVVRPENSSSKWKLVKLPLMVCGVFFCCWFPYNVCLIVNSTVGIHNSAISYTVNFGLLNSATNFVTYVLMNRGFRDYLKTVVCARRFR